MKKLFTKSKRLLMCIISYTILLLLNNCKKDYLTKSDNASNSILSEHRLDVKKLQTAYFKGIQVASSFHTSSVSEKTLSDMVGNLDVDWSSFYLQEFADSTKIIEFDMPNDTAMFAVASLRKGDPANYRNKTKVVFMLKKDSLTRSFFMKEIEDLNFKNSVSTIDQAHYKKIPNSFNGNILYFTLDRKFINGWTWKNGVITHSLSLSAEKTPTQKTQDVGKNTNNFQLVCHDVEIVYLQIEISYEYALSGGAPYIKLSQFTGSVQQCSWEGSFGSVGGGGGDSGGGVGGDTNPNPCAPINVSVVKGLRVNTQQGCPSTPPSTVPPYGSNYDAQGVVSDESSLESSTDPNDPSWWDDVLTTYPPQTLPTFHSMYLNYPKINVNGIDRDMPPAQVYNLIGGQVLGLYNSNPIANGNACAARVSRALLYSGVSIPYIPNKTFKGADDKYYFVAASALFDWMTKTFGDSGPNVKTFTRSQGGISGVNFPSLLSGIKGIYILKPVSRSPVNGFGASGHATIYNGNNCMLGSEGHPGEYFNARGGVELIRLWTLN